MVARFAVSKHSISTVFLVVSGALVLALVAVVPASGAGSSGLRYLSKTKAVPNAEPGTTPLGVTCPAAHPHVTGGGLQINGDESTLDLEVDTTRATNAGTRWLTVANNSSASSATMKATAICSKGTFTYVSVHKSVPPNKQGKLRALCPSGTKVTGGGGTITGRNHIQGGASTEPFARGTAGQGPGDGWGGRVNNSSVPTTTHHC